jgi:hypothetical protein
VREKTTEDRPHGSEQSQDEVPTQSHDRNKIDQETSFHSWIASDHSFSVCDRSFPGRMKEVEGIGNLRNSKGTEASAFAGLIQFVVAIWD